MNPIVKANSWNIAMEEAFAPASGMGYSNAAGMRKNCGGKPKRIFYRAGNPGKRDYQVAMDSYLRCTDEVRKMNVAQGLPADTGLAPVDTSSSGAAQNTQLPKVPGIPDMSQNPSTEERSPEGMSMGTKLLWGGGILLALTGIYFGVKHFSKGGAKPEGAGQ